MKITDEMLTAAVTKAVEAGMLPRRSLKDDATEARLLMREILNAALDNALPAKTDAKPLSRWASSPFAPRDGLRPALPRQGCAAGFQTES